MPRVGILADDLTGGADAAAPFLAKGMTATVVRSGELSSRPGDPDVVAYVSNSRDVGIELALQRVGEGLGSLERFDPSLLIKKIDSTLRGHVAAELALACRVVRPSLVVVAPAFPAHGRALLEGRLVLRGSSIGGPALSDLFRAEGLEVVTAPLATVRSSAFEDALRSAPPGSVVVCDAARDDDLHRVVAAAADLEGSVLWVGSGGLTNALAATLGRIERRRGETASLRDGPVLLVVGSWSERARVQAANVASLGLLRTIELDPGAVVEGAVDPTVLVASLAERHDVVLRVQGEVDGARADSVARGLAQLVGSARSALAGLVLTGGATAEAVLDELGIDTFELVRELETGVPLGVSPTGVAFVTKAGGFGDDLVLERCRVALHEALRGPRS